MSLAQYLVYSIETLGVFKPYCHICYSILFSNLKAQEHLSRKIKWKISVATNLSQIYYITCRSGQEMTFCKYVTNKGMQSQLRFVICSHLSDICVSAVHRAENGYIMILFSNIIVKRYCRCLYPQNGSEKCQAWFYCISQSMIFLSTTFMLQMYKQYFNQNNSK